MKMLFFILCITVGVMGLCENRFQPEDSKPEEIAFELNQIMKEIHKEIHELNNFQREILVLLNSKIFGSSPDKDAPWTYSQTAAD